MRSQDHKDLETPFGIPVRVTPREITDNGKVRIGGMSPSLPPLRIIPAAVSDQGKVRIGGMSPAL